MRSFILMKLLILGMIFTLSGGTFAAESMPYTEKGFKDAQEQGKTILLEFHAGWCSTCKKQKPTIESLLKDEKKLSRVVAFTVDYDTESDLKNALKVNKQSTLVIFKGKNEISRAIGITDKSEINKLISKGI